MVLMVAFFSGLAIRFGLDHFITLSSDYADFFLSSIIIVSGLAAFIREVFVRRATGRWRFLDPPVSRIAPLQKSEQPAPVSSNDSRVFTAVIERSRETNLYAGYVIGFAKVRCEGVTVDEVLLRLREVIKTRRAESAPMPESEFVAIQTIIVD